MAEPRTSSSRLTLLRERDGADAVPAASSRSTSPFPTVSVIVPTRNEQANVAPLVERLARAFAHGWSWQAVFVDDSDDETPSCVEALAAVDLPVRCIRRPPAERIGGLGGAVLAGFSAAEADVLVVMDGDLQHPPELAARLASAVALDVGDIVIASRFVPGASAAGLSGSFRRLVTGATRRAAHLAVPRSRRIQDPLSGFFAIRADVLETGPTRCDGFKVLLDVLACGSWETAVEVPFSLEERVAGASKAQAKEGLRFARQLWRLRTQAG